MEIKICGLTRMKEAEYLNEIRADYAGFVLFAKSKRHVTIEQAQEIFPHLLPSIKKVAVTVSPDAAFAAQIAEAGFDILQVHKELDLGVLRESRIPIWYAFNIADQKQLEKKQAFIEQLPEPLQEKIEAVVVDGAEYGSGRPFDWKKSKRLKKAGAQSPPDIFSRRRFVLAGGLSPDNVAEGIRLFDPDVVDVSSGVEGASGKDEELIVRFAESVRKAKAKQNHMAEKGNKI